MPCPAFGHFFAALLGADNPAGHGNRYSQHVERGGFVVVVDGQDDAEAQRASTLLRELQGGDVNVVQRAGQRPLREIVGTNRVAGMVERSREPYEAASLAGERAMASDRLDATAGPALRDPDVTHAPGLRYADQDKPNR